MNAVCLPFKTIKAARFGLLFVVLKCRVCEIFRTFRFSRFLHVSFFKPSTFRFAGLTQQYAKTSPLKLINDRIILEAKRMIRYSDLRIKEIAFDLGFKDDSYFIKLFKRNVGMSPIEFREKEK